MIDPKVALVGLAILLGVYGAKSGGHAVGHLFKRTRQVISHPVRHPVKDAKMVVHKVSGR